MLGPVRTCPPSEGVSGSVSDSLDSTPMGSEFDGQVFGKQQLEKEINSLVRYCNEEEGFVEVTQYRKDTGTAGITIQRKKIATFLEGSRLPFSALVKDIFEKLTRKVDQGQNKSSAVTLASVRSIVLSLGERISFGTTNPDTDVLEDDTAGSLWRWEVRDMRLLSKDFRDEIVDRRRWRKKISERIAALSATIEALRGAQEAGEVEQAAYLKAKEALAKVDNESVIRGARTMWQQSKRSATSVEIDPHAVQKNPLWEKPNNISHEAGNKGRRCDSEKEKLRQEKLLKRHQTENEKEQKRKDREEADQKKHQQRQQDVAEKEQKRKEKEEGERKKQEKKQQDEAEKEQKREAVRKKQLALKKQASFMDRFLVKKETASCGQSQQAEATAAPFAAESEKHESTSQSLQAVEKAAVVARMDGELKDINCAHLEELWRSHVNNWLNLRNQRAPRTPYRWGVRRKPKVSVYRELRLHGAAGDSRVSSQGDRNVRKVAELSSPAGHLKRSREEFGWCDDLDLKENASEGSPYSPLEVRKPNSGRYLHLRNKRRKLLQFDKSHRPPYYGTYSKRSEYVNSRRPLKKDPALDYDVDSDEEWEEEDPGESLSDVEKDEEDEKVEIEEIEDDEDGADEFVVPDGYLSGNEGVAMEDSERVGVGTAGSSINQCPTTPVHLNIMPLERLRKILDSATDRAIRSNHPLVVSNLGQVPGSEVDTQSSHFASNRTETICLEALRMRVLIPNQLIGAR